jgi:hypothetical protein
MWLVVEGKKRVGVIRRCVDERVLQGEKCKGEGRRGTEEDRNLTGLVNKMEKEEKKGKEKKTKSKYKRASISK